MDKKNFVHKTAARLDPGLLCWFVCLFRVQFKHLHILMEHEDDNESAEITSGVSYIKSGTRGSQGRRCITEIMLVARCHAFTRANAATSWTLNKQLYK